LNLCCIEKSPGKRILSTHPVIFTFFAIVIFALSPTLTSYFNFKSPICLVRNIFYVSIQCALQGMLMLEDVSVGTLLFQSTFFHFCNNDEQHSYWETSNRAAKSLCSFFFAQGI